MRIVLYTVLLLGLFVVGACHKSCQKTVPTEADIPPSEPKVTSGPQTTEPAPPPEVPTEMSLFDGQTLGHWKVTDFGGQGKVHIKDSVDFFWEDVGEETIQGRVKKSLEALNPVCYYGCLTSRPPKITDAKRPEDPQEMDMLLRSLGANVKH